MSILKIKEEDFETFTLVTNPRREFISSSINGVTGSLYLYARRSDIEKNTTRTVSARTHNDSTVQGALSIFIEQGKVNSDISSEAEQYLLKVNEEIAERRRRVSFNIKRTEPGVVFSSNSLKKISIKESLYPYYREEYPSAHWSYSNYHCLNFFTASSVPSSSVLLYPNSSSVSSNSVSGSYMPNGAFTFEFYINPKYTNDEEGSDFKAGTILHMSSTYAISLTTGSLKDSKGLVEGYKILLQLSHSADISPSLAANSNYPNDLIFTSNDNALRRNNWHHVAIRWGTSNVDNGTGSFIIDGENKGNFVIPSSTILPSAFTTSENPDVLCIGNFYEGNNTGNSAQSIFFNQDIALKDGVLNLAPSYNQYGPDSFSFNHPLNAEVHDIRIYNTYRINENIENDRRKGPTNLNNILFYLGPFFTKESPIRTVLSGDGNLFDGPYSVRTGHTDTPFEVNTSFSTGARYLNLENFLRDLVTGNYPRQLELTGSAVKNDNGSYPSNNNDKFYEDPNVVKRNLTIIPCDNGLFYPNYDLLKSGTFSRVSISGSNIDRYANDLGNTNLSFITLDNLISTSSYTMGVDYPNNTVGNDRLKSVCGITPDSPIGIQKNKFAIPERTKDVSSNEVVFFEIPQLFYGDRLKPGTFEVYDENISGSDAKVSIKIKDNSYGNLYRADCYTEQATWNSIGNIFYNEGIAVIKTPNIPFYGKDQFRTEFQGENSIHVLTLLAEAKAGKINSSSNPTFIPISSSLNANDNDKDFVYITHIDWLDDNFNVVMKTHLAQPIKKRNIDKILFKSKIDF